MSSKHVHTIVLIALMTAVICVLSPLSLPIGPVPISLATLAILLTAYLLGWKFGTVSVVIYILLGLVGVPVFSGFSGGAAKLFGPTGGYIIGYIPMTLISGLFITRFRKNYVLPVVGMLLGTLVLYIIGTAWLAYQMSMTFKQALYAGVIPFIPGDLIKIAVVAILGPILYAALCRAGMIQPDAKEKA